MPSSNAHPWRLGSAATSAIAAVLLSAIGAGAGGCQPAGAAGSMVEPMELQGRWLGMQLVAAESATSRELGVPASVAGVVVSDLLKAPASRAGQAGILRGDVLVAIDGTKVLNLADLYALTKAKNVAAPIGIDILRQGQGMTMVVPAPFSPTAMPMAGVTQAATQGTSANAPLFCPNDGLHWNPSQVGPDLRCPRCGGPLLR